MNQNNFAGLPPPKIHLFKHSALADGLYPDGRQAVRLPEVYCD